jgi:hypothetical protein
MVSLRRSILSRRLANSVRICTDPCCPRCVQKRAEIRTKTAALWKARPPCSTSKASTSQNLPSKVSACIGFRTPCANVSCRFIPATIREWVISCFTTGTSFKSIVFLRLLLLSLNGILLSSSSIARSLSHLGPSSRFAEIPMASVIYCRSLTTDVEFEVA